MPSAPEYQRKYRAANKERLAEQQRQRRITHKEEVAAYQCEYHRKYRAANKQSLSKQQKAWREANLEHYKKVKRRYYEENKQSSLEKSREWGAANREKVNIATRNCSLRANGVEGSYTLSDVKAIWVRQGMKCAVPGCTHPISDKRGEKNRYHVDHIRPLARGGSNWPSNLQILCRSHNLQKRNKDEYEWAQAHGMLFVR